MYFKSDNSAGVCPEIMKAIQDANIGCTASYGADEYSKKLIQKISEVFEHDVSLYLTAVGTASNALALSAMVPAYGTVYCHSHAHINTDECGAPELFTRAKLTSINGPSGKIDLQELEQKIIFDMSMRPHVSKPTVISVTQLTESGTVYTLNELEAIKACARKHELFIHMDGARFANALVTLGCTPAQTTWKVGVDVMSFGATKNGAMMAELVLFFNKDLAKDFDYRHKRAGQLMSKTRFEAAQFLAYLENDLWLKNAQHANRMAQKMAAILESVPGVTLAHAVQGNELFVFMSRVLADKLTQSGALFYAWGDGCYRFVTSWMTSDQDIQLFAHVVSKF